MSQIPSWAIKGAKVVCISDDWRLNDALPIRVPTVREVFTIEFVALDSDGVLLGLVEYPAEADGFWCFEVENFAPLVTRSQEQDIAEHFAGHLHQRVPEKA